MQMYDQWVSPAVGGCDCLHIFEHGSGLSPGSVSSPNGACSLAAVKSKGAKKKRKRGQDDSDEAEEFSESDSELGERRSPVIDALSVMHLGS